ncbi:response regulator transcription factor [Chloroflexi bacterium TSY]|nr:response regulator transcription factor [Chloroflexi bacterium TSY]
MSNKKILVVDDDRQIVRLVRSYLEQAGFSVLVAYDGETALHMIYREEPDLMVLDLGLPDRDGVEITQQVRADNRFGSLPIIMLTARLDDMDKIVGLEIGADDYVTKPFNAREVVARAIFRRQQLEGDSDTKTETLQIGRIIMHVGMRQVDVDGQRIELTPTEFNLLQTFMQSPGTTFSRDELLEKALGYGYEGLGRTLDSHIKNLRQKIEPDPRNPSYIQTVHRIGYRMTQDRH